MSCSKRGQHHAWRVDHHIRHASDVAVRIFTCNECTAVKVEHSFTVMPSMNNLVYETVVDPVADKGQPEPKEKSC